MCFKLAQAVSVIANILAECLSGKSSETDFDRASKL